MEIIVISILSYLMGSIPFGFILTKFFLKKDIRGIGSGNIGATNALRAGNKSLGYGTLFLDIIKAIIPVVYVKLNYPDYIFIASLCVFLGHIFPIWLKFKGGKAVSYTHLRAHETPEHLVCRLLLVKKKNTNIQHDYAICSWNI